MNAKDRDPAEQELGKVRAPIGCDLEAFATNVPAAIFVKDLDGRYTLANPLACEAMGCPSGIVGLTDYDLLPKDLADNLRRHDFEVVSTGSSVEREETVHDRRFLSVKFPLLDAQGQPSGICGVAIDITERKRAEERLAEATRQKDLLYQFLERGYRAGSLAEIYDAALEAISSALHCERASILRMDESMIMRFAAWRGLSDTYRKAVEGHSPWKNDESNPEPVCVSDVAAASLDDSLRAVLQAENIGSLAFIPLMARGKLIGKFMVYFDTPHVFSDEEIELSLNIAHQLGLSMERKTAEEALHASERRLELALSAGRMGVWEWNIATGQVIWSPSLERIHGLKPGTFGGRFEDVTRDIHPDDAPELLLRVQEALRTHREYHVQYRFVSPEGTPGWLEASGRVLRGADGEPEKMIGVCMDITARKQAEQALREREERYELVVAGADAAIWDWDVAAQRVVFSPRWKELRGLSDTEVSDREEEWSSRIHPDDFERVMAAVRAHFEGQTPFFAAEYRVLRKDGRWIWILDRGIARHDATGRVTRMAGSETDITERKRAEEALRASEERFRRMADNAPVMVWVTEPDGTCTFLSKSWYEFTGQVPETGLGFGWMEAVHADDREHTRKTFLVANERREAFRLEYRLRRIDGEYRWMIDSAAPHFGVGGEFLGYIGSVIDISERKQVEERLETVVAERTRELRLANEALLRDMAERKQLEEQLLQAQKLESIGVLAGGIAHDFNNILNIIQAYAFLLRADGAQNKNIDESVAVIQETVKRGSALVRQLLTMARKGSTHVESLNMNALVDALVGLLTQTIPKTITLDKSFEANLPLLMGDKNQIEQALLNLCVNARDAMPNGGTLNFRT